MIQQWFLSVILPGLGLFRVSQSTRLKWEKKHVWQHIAAVCGCVPLPCSHQPLLWSPSLHWPTRTARELCSGQQSKLTMTPPPPPTTDSNASRGHESSLMRSLKPEHNCEAEWPINNPIALETVHSSVNPHVSLVRRLSGGVFVSLWCPLETFLMNRYGDVLSLVSSLLQREQPSQPAAARSVLIETHPPSSVHLKRQPCKLGLLKNWDWCLGLLNLP